MRNLLLIMLLGVSILSYGQESASLKLVIKKFEHDQGMVRAGLYNAAELWLENSFRDADTIIYSTEEVVLYFNDIPSGQYAISIYHDENNNGGLDTNSIGIPSEDYAFSNNAKGMFGPAKYEDAVFSVSGGETLHIINLN